MENVAAQKTISAEDLRDIWPTLTKDERVLGFLELSWEDEDEFFLSLSAHEQAQIFEELPPGQRRVWMRLLAPDDAADVLQEVDPMLRPTLLDLLDDATRREVVALMAYAEDDAGGLMSPRFARVRPNMLVGEAIRYLHRQARKTLETLQYVYVLEHDQKLIGVCSFRELFSTDPDMPVADFMNPEPVTIKEDTDQEAIVFLFQKHGFIALPVADDAGHMKGIVTIDDIVDVVLEEATEDVQKMGGLEALDEPYLQTPYWDMIRKRAGWLAILFVGEMLTASAMSYYEGEISKAVILAVFIPLIISSGGNSGSQACTLIIRAMALDEIRLKDWRLIMGRELLAGFALGLILAVLGMVRIVVWQLMFNEYGTHWPYIVVTVGVSLVGVVTCGSFAGSMLPFVLRRAGFDPASASAPFVATLVDVAGLVIYFSTASVVMRGVLL